MCPFLIPYSALPKLLSIAAPHWVNAKSHEIRSITCNPAFLPNGQMPYYIVKCATHHHCAKW